MFIPPVLAYKNNTPAAQFQGKTSSITEIADLRVFHHHIYEFKKGIRNQFLLQRNQSIKKQLPADCKKIILTLLSMTLIRIKLMFILEPKNVLMLSRLLIPSLMS